MPQQEPKSFCWQSWYVPLCTTTALYIYNCLWENFGRQNFIIYIFFKFFYKLKKLKIKIEVFGWVWWVRVHRLEIGYVGGTFRVGSTIHPWTNHNDDVRLMWSWWGPLKYLFIRVNIFIHIPNLRLILFFARYSYLLSLVKTSNYIICSLS